MAGDPRISDRIVMAHSIENFGEWVTHILVALIPNILKYDRINFNSKINRRVGSSLEKISLIRNKTERGILNLS